MTISNIHFSIVEFPRNVDHAPVEITNFIDDRTNQEIWDVWSDGKDIGICSSYDEAVELANDFIASWS